jgi:hypothetical protein
MRHKTAVLALGALSTVSAQGLFQTGGSLTLTPLCMKYACKFLGKKSLNGERYVSTDVEYRYGIKEFPALQLSNWMTASGDLYHATLTFAPLATKQLGSASTFTAVNLAFESYFGMKASQDLATRVKQQCTTAGRQYRLIWRQPNKGTMQCSFSPKSDLGRGGMVTIMMDAHP